MDKLLPSTLTEPWKIILAGLQGELLFRPINPHFFARIMCIMGVVMTTRFSFKEKLDTDIHHATETTQK